MKMHVSMHVVIVSQRAYMTEQTNKGTNERKCSWWLSQRIVSYRIVSLRIELHRIACIVCPLHKCTNCNCFSFFAISQYFSLGIVLVIVGYSSVSFYFLFLCNTHTPTNSVICTCIHTYILHNNTHTHTEILTFITRLTCHCWKALMRVWNIRIIDDKNKNKNNRRTKQHTHTFTRTTHTHTIINAHVNFYKQ